MPTNNFRQFCPTDITTNLPTQADYLADPDLAIGNQPGVASSKLNNKALRQGTAIAAAIAQYMANISGDDVLDDANQTNLLATMAKTFATPVLHAYAGYHPTANATWARTNTAYGDFTNTGTAVLTQRSAKNMTVVTAGGNLPGLSWTPDSAGYYLIQLSAAWASAAGSLAFALTDGSTIFAENGQVNNAGNTTTTTIIGLYDASAWVSGAVTIKLQAKSNGANLITLAGNVGISTLEWVIQKLK